MDDRPLLPSILLRISLASAGEDHTIRVWDWHAGVLQRTLVGHTKAVTDVDFDRGGNLLGAYVHDSVVTHLVIHSELFQ